MEPRQGLCNSPDPDEVFLYKQKNKGDKEENRRHGEFQVGFDLPLEGFVIQFPDGHQEPRQHRQHQEQRREDLGKHDG